jgi:hypothetical protein
MTKINIVHINYGELKESPVEKFYLSTDPYHFIYRPDKNNEDIKRATLFDGDRKVDDVRVSAYPEFGLPEKSHHDVINYFEARLTMNLIK